MKAMSRALVVFLFIGCGPDRELLMETRFDPPLRQKIAQLSAAEDSELLFIQGKCSVLIEEQALALLTNAGAQVQSKVGNEFTAVVSPDLIFDLAALDIVDRLQLSRRGRVVSLMQFHPPRHLRAQDA